MRDRAAFGPWAVSLAISGVLILLIELNKHHYAAHRLSARILGGVLGWVAFGAVIRFFAYVVHRAGGPSRTPPPQ